MDETSDPRPFGRLPRIGEPAIPFHVRTTMGERRLEDYRGRWLLLFSHPADFTPVCTSEFVAFARAFPRFQAMGCDLLGLSVDSVFAHIAWVRGIRDAFGLEVPFPVAEDISMAVAGAYGMIHPADTDTSTVRATFLIDPAGIVRLLSYYPLSNGRDVGEVLRALAALQETDASGLSHAGGLDAGRGWGAPAARDGGGGRPARRRRYPLVLPARPDPAPHPGTARGGLSMASEDGAPCDPQAAAEMLRALAHPMRLAILCRLLGGEAAVSVFEEELGLRQPSLSQQLAFLRDAGLVATRRVSKSVIYRLTDARVRPIIAVLRETFDAATSAAPDSARGHTSDPSSPPIAAAPSDLSAATRVSDARRVSPSTRTARGAAPSPGTGTPHYRPRWHRFRPPRPDDAWLRRVLDRRLAQELRE